LIGAVLGDQPLDADFLFRRQRFLLGRPLTSVLSPDRATAATQRPTLCRFTPTAAAAAVRVWPSCTILTATRRNSVWVALSCWQKSRMLTIRL
jgi:hypothetical protein